MSNRSSIFNLCSGKNDEQTSGEKTMMPKIRSPEEIEVQLQELLQQKLRSNPNQVIDIITIRKPLALAHYRTEIRSSFQPSVSFQYHNPIILNSSGVHLQGLPNSVLQSTPPMTPPRSGSSSKVNEWSTNNSSLRSSMIEQMPRPILKDRQAFDRGRNEHRLFHSAVPRDSRPPSVDATHRRMQTDDSRILNLSGKLDWLERKARDSGQHLQEIRALIAHTRQIPGQAPPA